MHKRDRTPAHIDETRRFFFRVVPGLPLKRQQDMAREDGFVPGHSVTYLAGKTAEMRDEWAIRCRAGDTLWVARLSLIAEPGTKGRPRPGPDMAATITHITSVGAILMDGYSKVTSKDGEKWRLLVRDEMNLLGQGRRLAQRPSLAKEMSARAAELRTAHAKRTVWQRPEKAKLLELVRSMWRNRKDYPHAEAAAVAINGMLRDMGHDEIGGWRTIYDICGPRK